MLRRSDLKCLKIPVKPIIAARTVRFDREYFELSGQWLCDPEIKNLTMSPCCSAENRERWFQNLHKRKDYCIWGIECEGKPVGATGIKNINGDQGEYWGYIGEKKFWGRGIGKWMLQRMLEEAMIIGLKRIYLKVHKENDRAMGLYQRFQFIVCGEQDGCWVMELRL